MEALLQNFCASAGNNDEIPLWIALINGLRPSKAHNVPQATNSLKRLTLLLKSRPEYRSCLGSSLARLFRERKQVSLYVSSGLLSSTGFFSEVNHRLSGRWLPDVIDHGYLKDLLGVLFHRRDDEHWVNAIADEAWADLLQTLLDTAEPVEAMLPGELIAPPRAITEIIEALRMLSYHVAAIGLDPELVHVDPILDEYESPFLAQNAELGTYIDNYKSGWLEPKTTVQDGAHLAVLLDQCRAIKDRIRRRAARFGTSLALSFKLERLDQHLERMHTLLEILGGIQAPQRSVSAVVPHIVSLFKELVRAECRKNRLSDYLGKHLELLSLRVTENAGRTGEHYITLGRDDYFAMLRSAAGAGYIVAFMAAFKIILSRQELAPLNAVVALCLTYAIGFVVIHMLHFTLATKQPAMTANAIAAAIEEKGGKARNLDNLVELVVRTLRSQFAAVLGNVAVAMPAAILLGLAIRTLFGSEFVAREQAEYLLAGLNPFTSASLAYAAIAGVCLFLGGLIAGYYDNVCVYNRIPQRLRQLVWPRRFVSEARMERVADYVENNLGALAGNFALGCMLGGVWALGMLFGLPLDVRHVTLSSAQLGYAMVALDSSSWPMIAMAALGVGVIGLVNLAVSFALALTVALRARNVTFAQGRSLIWLLFKRFSAQPRDFFLPPRGL